MELYSYFRSSASWRVRIAMALKGLDYDYLPIHLVKKEQLSPEFVATSGTGLVPLLVTDEGLRLHQSLAIIEYLDETMPEPPLLPREALGRARVRALAQDIACEIHPLNNLRVLQYLTGRWARARTPRARGSAIGSRAASRWSNASSPRNRPRSATATRPAWPTARWCRRCSTRSASSAGSTTCPT